MKHKPRFLLWFLYILVIEYLFVYFYIYDLAFFDQFFKLSSETSRVCWLITAVGTVGALICGYRAFFNLEQVKAQEIIPYLATSLGFIGTIIGFILAVQVFKDSDVSTETGRMAALTELPKNMFIALFTTLFGVCVAVSNRLQMSFLRFPKDA